MNLSCGHCGKFMESPPYDEYTNFGRITDMDPPDPIYLCEQCSRKITEEMIDNQSLFLPWRLGKCHWRAVKQLGLVVAGAKGNSWAMAYWPDKLPQNYEIWESPYEEEEK